MSLLSADEALHIVLAHSRPQTPQCKSLLAALGDTLAEPVLADRDYPPFHRAMMDGFAVRVADAGAWVPLSGVRFAGQDDGTSLPQGTALEIMTGAPCPPGAEAVVPVEMVERAGDRVRLPPALRLGAHIAPRGGERRVGDPVAEAGTVVTPPLLAALATVGADPVRVRSSPSLGILVTGDELHAGSGTPGAATIRDADGPLVEAMARAAGVSDIRRLKVPDHPEALAKALDDVADRDIVVLTGGVSAGAKDHVPTVLQQAGVTRHFHKVAQKPGKPLWFGTRGQQLFFGLPGNPLACQMGFHRYVEAAIRVLRGLNPHPLPMVGRLADPLRVDEDRELFLLARAVADPERPGVWRVRPLPGRGSGDVFAGALANAYLRIPVGAHAYAAGTELPFEWMGARRWLD